MSATSLLDYQWAVYGWAAPRGGLGECGQQGQVKQRAAEGSVVKVKLAAVPPLPLPAARTLGCTM